MQLHDTCITTSGEFGPGSRPPIAALANMRCPHPVQRCSGARSRAARTKQARDSPGPLRALCGLTLAGALGQFWLRSASIRVSHLASFDLEVDLRTRLTDHLARVGLGPVADLGSGAIKWLEDSPVR